MDYDFLDNRPIIVAIAGSNGGLAGVSFSRIAWFQKLWRRQTASRFHAPTRLGAGCRCGRFWILRHLRQADPSHPPMPSLLDSMSLAAA